MFWFNPTTISRSTPHRIFEANNSKWMHVKKKKKVADGDINLWTQLDSERLLMCKKNFKLQCKCSPENLTCCLCGHHVQLSLWNEGIRLLENVINRVARLAKIRFHNTIKQHFALTEVRSIPLITSAAAGQTLFFFTSHRGLCQIRQLTAKINAAV